MKRRQLQQQKSNNEPDAATKQQYRCSLINLENTQDEELDAILGELSVLESQFENEIAGVDKQLSAIETKKNKEEKKEVTIPTPKVSPTEEVSDVSTRSSGLHSISSSGSASNVNNSSATTTSSKSATNNANVSTTNGRQHSPDTDSAFCDNLSVLSSCSAGSSSRTDQSKSSSSGVSSTASPTTATSQGQDQEARIKAEKIKLAIEKIKEASVKKLFVKVFTSDGSAKSILIDEKMTVGHVTRILAEKNHVKLDTKWTIVELVPELYMERVYEDNENLVENCLMWKVDSKNTLWFIERPEKYDMFVRPELYLLGSSSSQKGDQMEDHARQELIEEYFSSSGVGAPEVEGFIWLKAENKKSWKKFFFVLRSSGLYYAPKGKKTSKDLVCLSKFDVNQVYYGAGWKKKYKSPTDYCLAIKHPQIQAKSPKYIRYLCVESEKELHQWVTGIRIAKNGKQIYENYRSIEEEITHADIDILTSKRFSVNSPNSLQLNPNVAKSDITSSSPARTPSSENKSLDSALSSGIVSDISNVPSSSNASSAASVTSSSNYNVEEDPSSSQNATPVNTIDRGHLNDLRRSMSRSSGSSSGCLSDRSNSHGGLNGAQSLEGGFDTDFPAGGTIKKRPSVNPRIPLTSTTWGMVRDSDEDSNDAAGPNVRVGGGGTLLRSAMRQSLRKNSMERNLPQQTIRNSNGSLESDNSSGGGGPQHHQVHVQVHHQPHHQAALCNDVDPMSAEFESNLNLQNGTGNVMTASMIEESLPLPPPPRDESIDRLSALDDLPPPPPEIYEEVQVNNNLPSNRPPNGRPVPMPLPPSLKRNTPSPMATPKKQPPNGMTRRISFDDKVQMIGDDFPKRQPLPTPHKLYSEEQTSQAAPPKTFLTDLQRVMNKKWQIAEKCKVDQNTTPHQVLGFRDEVQHLVGQPQTYSRDESVGQWVLQSQRFANGQTAVTQEPLYAVARKTPGGLRNGGVSHYAPSHVHQQHYQQAANGHPQQQQQQHYQQTSQGHQQQHYQAANGRPPQQQQQHYQQAASGHPQQHLPGYRPPVILREPTPEYDPYASLKMSNGTYGCHSQERADVISNYSTINFTKGSSGMSTPPPPPLSGLSPAHRGSFRGSPKKPPPPPKRSENTHLTTA